MNSISRLKYDKFVITFQRVFVRLKDCSSLILPSFDVQNNYSLRKRRRNFTAIDIGIETVRPIKTRKIMFHVEWKHTMSFAKHQS